MVKNETSRLRFSASKNKPSKPRKFPPSEDLSYPDFVYGRRHANEKDTLRTQSSADTSSGSIDKYGGKTTPSKAPNHPLQRIGSGTTIKPVVSSQKQKQLDQLAVSVHYLSTQFLKEVRAAGHTRKSPIYVIENLSGPPGVIRQKGQNVTCPVDGKKSAAYVHSISGQDNVGKANYMLSYSWSYSIGDIIDTLVDFCHVQNRDPKRSYVWICCLCINQHRVAVQTLHEQDEKSGMFGTITMDFFTLFGERVVGIGHILAMMAPWDNPTYLSRVWCVFELYTASEKGCEITIVMPPSQTKALEKDLFSQKSGNIDRLYEVLANTKVQNAKSTVEKDRVAILDIVKQNPGFAALNTRVNELLRGWARRVVTDIIRKRARERTMRKECLWYRLFCCFLQQKHDLIYANFCHDVAVILLENDENDAALEILDIAKTIRESLVGEHHPSTATCYTLIGSGYHRKGLYEEALQMYRKGLAIRESVLGEDHADTGSSHNQIGTTLEAIGDYGKALSELQRALVIRQKALGANHEQTAEVHGSISSVLECMGNYDGALEECRKALKIREAVVGVDHPNTASLYGILGSLYFSKGELDMALVETHRALAIEEIVLGTKNTDTASTYNNLGLLLKTKGEYDEALLFYRKALCIFEAVHGDKHPYTARSRNNIAVVHQVEGNYDEALREYRTALEIKETMLPPTHPDLATSYTNIGTVLSDMKEYDAALKYLEKALQLRKEAFGEDHIKLVNSYNNLGGALQMKGDFEGALVALRKSLDITEANLGRNCRDAKALLGRIYILLRLTAK